jgi:asparaginyl-tRNA synthetase
LSSRIGESVTLRGWVQAKRSSGKIHFVQIRDGSGVIQGVASRNDVSDAAWAELERATQESTITATGVVREDKRSHSGVELGLTEFRVDHLTTDFPISPKEHGTAFLMEHRHLWLRSTRQHAIARVRHTVVKAARDYLDDRGYLLVDTPIFTPAACEGTTTLFGVPYFDEGTAYLTQSGQLYSEATVAAHGKVYCFGPTFRAEKSKTRRHLTEFWMVEPEIAFAHLDDAIALAEGLVCHVVEQALTTRKAELAVLERDTSKLESVQAPFPRLHYRDAMKLVREKGSETPIGSDFGGADETLIAQAYERPVVVHRFPSAIKAFYMAPDPDEPEYSLSADILAPEGYGEIVGGGERLADLELLVKRIREHGLPEESFRWYLDLRRYGTVPHAGFGLGLERTIIYATGMANIRDVIPFPRTPGQAAF